MTSLSISLSTCGASSVHSASPLSFHTASSPPSPNPLTPTSASSSQISFTQADEENITITGGRLLSVANGNGKGHDDLQLLAVSTRITELFYSISDIQTRIFEIQELRHKSQSSTDLAAATGVIDQALMALDERLESVARGVKAVNDLLEPLSQSAPTPTPDASNEEPSESVLLLRKHATFMSEWESVQEESEVLREELKEDKWLTVFRTVTEQADGMMSSLEKAITRCQDFIWQFQRYGPDDSLSASSSMTSMGSLRSQKSPLNMEVFQSLFDSYEAKKKHYMPATTKVLSIIDKGVQDRVTKNGECLRRHADSTQRWKHIRERITRTDAEMEAVRRILTGEEEITPSDSGSVVSGPTSKSNSRSGYLTPPSASSSKKSLSLSASSALSRSVSPFRKFARKLTGSGKSPVTTTPPVPQANSRRTPASAPKGTLRHRPSLFNLTNGQPSTPATPERLGHKYSQSLTPESTPSSRVPDQDASTTIKIKTITPAKQPWNSSTRVNEDHRPRRPSGVTPHRPEGIQPASSLPSGHSPYQRSVSRSSMASSRPWSPVMSSVSTAASTNQTHPQRPPSRSHLHATSPHARPKTPSHIPSPSHFYASSDSPWDDGEHTTSLMQRAFSPDHSPPRAMTPGGTRLPGPRPPSRSMIPAPTFQILSPSRPGTTLSNYRDHDRDGRESPTLSHSSFRAAALRSQTPEATLRIRAQAVPFYGSISAGSGSSSTNNSSPRATRPSGSSKLPPSSFRETSSSLSSSLSSSTPPSATQRTTPSRPSSRLSDFGSGANPTYVYTPGNPRDPLDAEIAAIVNSIAHGLLIERVDPPLRSMPREGEEVRAQYAFSNSLARKTVTCRLTTLSRAGSKGEASTATKKVMVRVGGGWQDLQLYMLNRAAGM